MTEYIEREAILKHTTSVEVGAFSEWDIVKVEHIKNATAADVVEVRHGEWVDNGDRDRNGVSKPFATSCSVCGSFAGTSWMNYCPNCGAKMDGDKNG